jgi:Glucose-regulated metallo-peptidase M90
MLSKFFYIPLVMGTVVPILVGFFIDANYYIYAVPFVIGLAVVYTLSPQIDWWWYQRHPPELPAMVRHLINTNLPFYQNLSAAEKTRFRTRTAMYMEANEFMAQGMEAVPPDVKGIAAASVVQLTFYHEDYLLSKFEHIVIYPHPFPSPQHPEEWHVCEHFEEDGVIMFSAEQLVPGFLEPKRFLNIGLYEYARVFMRCHPEVSFHHFDEEHWPAFEQISGFPKDKTIQFIGLKEIDMTALAVVYFFCFEEKFKAKLPKEFEALARALKMEH